MSGPRIQVPPRLSAALHSLANVRKDFWEKYSKTAIVRDPEGEGRLILCDELLQKAYDSLINGTGHGEYESLLNKAAEHLHAANTARPPNLRLGRNALLNSNAIGEVSSACINFASKMCDFIRALDDFHVSTGRYMRRVTPYTRALPGIIAPVLAQEDDLERVADKVKEVEQNEVNAAADSSAAAAAVTVAPTASSAASSGSWWDSVASGWNYLRNSVPSLSSLSRIVTPGHWGAPSTTVVSEPSSSSGDVQKKDGSGKLGTSGALRGYSFCDDMCQ